MSNKKDDTKLANNTSLDIHFHDHVTCHNSKTFIETTLKQGHEMWVTTPK